MVRIGIIGSASYTGGELLRLLINHPKVEIGYLESSSNAGKKVDQIHRFLKGLIELELKKYNFQEIVKSCDLVFVCRSSGDSMQYVSELMRESAKIQIIDLGGDFRLKDSKLYPIWYKFEHQYPELLSKAVYGLSELYADKIRTARLVSNPGCYATSVILALVPLLAEEKIDSNSILVSSYSGISGAGRTYKEGFNLFLDLYGNARPYRVGSHQHTPEIEQELSSFAKKPVVTTFVPHILPIDKGILTTIWAKPNPKVSLDDLYSIYRKYYQNKPFIRIREKGDYPQVMDVVDTNFCDIGLEYDPRTNSMVIFSAEDNAIKGASGQAIQNMNLMCGFPETLGLPLTSTRQTVVK